MKIRIKGNSLRYRLTRPEVQGFSETGLVEERVNFGAVALTYALCKTDARELSAGFANNRIVLYLPAAFIDEWVHTDKVGFDHRMPLAGTDESLYLLVEKDYSCLDKVEEDQSDNYPNPLLKKSL
jgi:Family of unknown function (DUF7009)